jgi:tRNA (cmo5U34)-methyltransferase
VEAVWQGTRDRTVEIHGVDSSPEMVARSRQLLDLPNVFFHEGDAVSCPLEGAGMIVLNFTLQFVPLDEREKFVARCYEALVPGGVLFLSEKFVSDCEEDEEWLRELHWEFKRQQGYSEMEIAGKRQALEEVLIPESSAAHEERLRQAGFGQVTKVLQCLNFASWVARK